MLCLSGQLGAPELRVSDRGPGVPVEYIDRIFEPCSCLLEASERAGGVGLGLARVKSIAERHGWGLRCEGRSGVGACFVIFGLDQQRL